MLMTCNTTGKSYFYVTDDIENGNWHVSQTDKCYDPGLLFDDNGKGVKKYVSHPADTFDDHAMYLREMLSSTSTISTSAPINLRQHIFVNYQPRSRQEDL